MSERERERERRRETERERGGCMYASTNERKSEAVAQ